MMFISLDNRGLEPAVKHTSKYMQTMRVTSNARGDIAYFVCIGGKLLHLLNSLKVTVYV